MSEIQHTVPRYVLHRISEIKVVHLHGFSHSTNSEALATLPTGRALTTADWSTLSASWHEDLNARINLLTQLRDELSECIGCGCLSLESCQLRNANDRLAKKGPGAHF